jgi:hypothetical protein
MNIIISIVLFCSINCLTETAAALEDTQILPERITAEKQLILGLPVKIRIPNPQKYAIYVRVSVEQYLEESRKWEPFAPALLAEQLKPKDTIHEIMPAGSELIWQISESHEAFHPKLGKFYRFVIQVSNSNNIYTKPFEFIKKPSATTNHQKMQNNTRNPQKVCLFVSKLGEELPIRRRNPPGA